MAIRKLLKHLVEALMALSLLGMVVAVFGNVVQRYLWGTGRSSPGAGGRGPWPSGGSSGGTWRS